MPPDQEPAADGLESAFTDLVTGGQPSPEAPTSEPNPFVDGFMDNEPAPTEEKPSVEGEQKPTKDDEDAFPDEPPSQASGKANEVWKGLKTEVKELRKTREQLRTERDERQAALDAKEAELVELRERASRVPDLEQKATLVEDAEKKLAIYHVEQSTEWQNTILKPLDAIGTNVELIAKANELRISDLDNALTEPDPVKRRELLKTVTADMDAIDRDEVLQMAKDTQAILSKQADMRAQAFEARKELEAVTKANETKAQAEARKIYETAAENGIVELQKRIPFMELTKGETVEGFFSGVLAKAKVADFNAASPATKAYSAAAGLILPRIVKQFDALKAENETLKARVGKENADIPTVGADPQTTQSVVTEIDFQNFMGNG